MFNLPKLPSRESVKHRQFFIMFGTGGLMSEWVVRGHRNTMEECYLRIMDVFRGSRFVQARIFNRDLQEVEIVWRPINASVGLERLWQDNGGSFPVYAWPGGYPILYLDKDCCILCPACAQEIAIDMDSGETIVDYFVYMEGPVEYCEECNAEIESAYGDPTEVEPDPSPRGDGLDPEVRSDPVDSQG